MAKNNWKEFEQLVASIEAALRNQPGVTVTHNAKLPSSYGPLRQIDVLITIDTPTFKKKIAIECKNTQSKAGVAIVEAFHSKVKAIGADEGIIVASSGFQSAAHLAAAHYQIRLFLLSQAKEVEAMFKELPLWPFEIKQEVIDAFVGFSGPTPINHLVEIKTALKFNEHDDVRFSIDELLRIFLNSRSFELSHSIFQSFVSPGKAQRIIVSNEIKLEFPAPVPFCAQGIQTEVVGFRAIIRTTLTTSPADLHQASVYEDTLHKEPQTLVFQLNFSEENLNWLQKEWGKDE